MTNSVVKDLDIFTFENSNVRALVIDNEPWFVGKDVADILGYKDLNRAINQHVDREDRKPLSRKDKGDSYPSLWSKKYDFAQKIVINESGVYSLIFGSELPTAKDFKHWVTSEVLPAIRKHGAYMTDEKAFDVVHNASGLADLLQQAADQLKAKDIQINEMKPKALFADAVDKSSKSVLIGDLAKLIKQNGIDIGANRLFNWMRDNHYLISRKGNDYNSPTQKSMELELLTLNEHTITKSDGTILITKTPMVTGKGQRYFIDKFVSSFVK